MAARAISITSSSANSTVGQTFTVSGTCSFNHAITVRVRNASDDSLVASSDTTVGTGTNVWSAEFTKHSSRHVQHRGALWRPAHQRRDRQHHRGMTRFKQ